MHQGGEATMAASQTAITLQTLLPMKGYRLLPLIGQTLYNLTCVENHYKNVERSIKYLTSIMSLPLSTGRTRVRHMAISVLLIVVATVG